MSGGAPGFTQGLLASLQPWLTGGSPSALDNSFAKYGGTTGLLSAMLQDSPGSQGAAAFGRALQTNQDQALQRASGRQALAQQGMGLQLFASKMPAMERWYGMLGNMLGGGRAPMPPQQAAPQPQSGAVPGGTPGGAIIPAVLAAGAGAAGGAPGGSPAAAPAQPAPVAPAPGAGAAPGGVAPGGGGFWGNPLGVMRLGTIGSALGMPGGAQFMDYGKSALQYDPAVANQMATAKNQISQDMTQLYEAYKTGDPAVIQGLQTKLKEDMGQLHVGSMSGIMTRQNPDGSWTTINPSSGLRTNSRSGSTFLPGAIGAFAARAAAEAGGEKGAQLAAETNPVGAGGYGGAAAPVPQAQGAAPGGGSAALGPNHTPTPSGWDAVQTPGFVPQILEQSGNTRLAPGNTGAAELKSFQGEQAKSADETLDQLQAKADAAQQIVTQTQEIDTAAQSFTPNAYANIRGKLLAALQPTGWLTQSQVRALGSYQTASKVTINLQTAMTKSMGSREAAQVFDRLGHAVTSVSLSPQGLQMLSGWQKGMARWQIAQNAYGQRLRAQANVAAINNLPATFQTHSNPAYFILASLPAPVRARLIAQSPDPQGLQRSWKQAYANGLAPSPTDFGAQ